MVAAEVGAAALGAQRARPRRPGGRSAAGCPSPDRRPRAAPPARADARARPSPSRSTPTPRHIALCSARPRRRIAGPDRGRADGRCATGPSGQSDRSLRSASAAPAASTAASSRPLDASRLAPCAPVAARLADREEAGKRAAARHVGQHPADGVVGGRRDRDQVGGQVEPVRGAQGGHRRETPAHHLGVEVAHVEGHVRAGDDRAPGDRAGHDVTGAELGHRVLVEHEPPALVVAQQRRPRRAPPRSPARADRRPARARWGGTA